MESIPVIRGKALVRCPACGKKVAIAIDRVHDRPVCGACKGDVAVDQPLELNEANFAEVVRTARVPLLVDFWSPGCGPCRAMEPSLVGIARSRSGRALIGKINTLSNQRIAEQFQVQAVPTLILFRGGQVAERQVGALPLQALDQFFAA